MTQLDNETQLKVEESAERAIPKVKDEEDIPFPSDEKKIVIRKQRKSKPDDDLSETDPLTKFRFATGRKVLYISMGAMGVAVVADILAATWLSADNSLIESAFEAFKLITMTVLGYIFGSNSSSGANSTK